MAMRARTKWTFVVFFALSIFWRNAVALTADEVRRQLDEIIAAEMLSPTSEMFGIPNVPNKDRIASLLIQDSRIVEADALTKELVSQVVYDRVIRYRTSLAEAKSLSTFYKEKLLSSPSLIPAGNYLQLLIPYVRDAGFCTGDPLSEAGASCAFSFVPAEFENQTDVAGTIQFEGDKQLVFPTIAPGSDLYEVMAGCVDADDRCRQLAEPLISVSAGQVPTHQLSTTSSRGTKSAKGSFLSDLLPRLFGISSASVVFRKNLYIVMPAKAGIQCLEKALDSGSRSRRSLGRNDERYFRNTTLAPKFPGTILVVVVTKNNSISQGFRSVFRTPLVSTFVSSADSFLPSRVIFGVRSTSQEISNTLLRDPT